MLKLNCLINVFMKKKAILTYFTPLFIILGCIYAVMCYSRIADLNLAVNPMCKECFSPANTHAGCAIFIDNKILLVKDKKSKKWGFPAGKHEMGERAFQTAYRETLEETGLHVFIDDYLGEFKEQNFRLFRCNIIEDTKKHDNEIFESKFFSKDEVKKIIDSKTDARFLNQLEFVYKLF